MYVVSLPKGRGHIVFDMDYELVQEISVVITFTNRKAQTSLF